MRALIDYLERLDAASRAGDFRVSPPAAGLSEVEAKIAGLISSIVGNYRAALEYDLMKYRLTGDALGIGLWDMDVVNADPINPRNSFTWSPELRRMLGFEDEKDFPNLLSSWSGILHPDDKERVLAALFAHISDLSGKTPYDIEYRMKLKSGEYRHFRAFGATQRAEGGVPVRVAGGLMDIDERIRMEREVGEASDRLKKALEQATAASRAKGDFLSSMSHEMRTPMNAIIGMTAIGKKAPDIEQKDRALNKIEEASAHLLGVINDVLDMAKIEADKLELSPVEYDFEKMLKNVLNVVGFRVDEKRQSLTINIDENIPRFVIGDDKRLSQVITNLLSNAVKFTPDGGSVSLSASLAAEDYGECKLRVEVADSGIGISAKQQAKLFRAFEQAESGTSREFGGTGLGLAISKRIVELMGGGIEVTSELGKGAAFAFTANVLRGREPHEDIGSRHGFENDYDRRDGTGESSGMIADEFTGKNMLLVEDMDINRDILITLLRDTGIDIDSALSGLEALNMVAADPEKYDIIFMDVHMPHMDGLEATRRIRDLPKRKRGRLPIIAMTANVFKGDIEECMAAGMDGHLGKPLDFEKILKTLREYLAG